jgi:hypothetical protein
MRISILTNVCKVANVSMLQMPESEKSSEGREIGARTERLL